MKPYDRPLLEIFAAEQSEHVQRLRAVAETLSAAPPAAFQEALRRAHTLKGAARAVGLETTEGLAHRLEALLEGAQEGTVAADAQAAAAVHHVLDAMEDVLASALGNRPEPDVSAATDRLDRLLAVPAPPAAAPAAPLLPSLAAPAADFVRVNAARIDVLIRASSQMLASATAESPAGRRTDESLRHAEETLTEFLSFRRECAPYLRRHAGDPELTPVRECLEYADGRLRQWLAGARAAAAAQHHQSWEFRQRAEQLHQGAIRVRMIPAESVFGAFGAMVREIAHEEGKQVEFRAEGLETQADRLALQALKDPVMHLLRNAVSHGIEPPGERVAAGKPAAGAIRLRLDANGDRLLVAVEDDGRGLDFEAVAAEALRLGLIAPNDANSLTHEDLSKLIFHPGLSTSKAITSVSGRGMGLAVVEQAVAQLQGELSVRPRPAAGLRIAISVALSISTEHILLLDAAGYTFGLATRFVERLCRPRVSQLASLQGRQAILLDGLPVPVVRLADLLGLPAPRAEGNPPREERDPFLSVAVLAADGQNLGLIAERFLDDRQAVVKDLGLAPESSGLASGGVPLEDGTVAILLNPAALIHRFRESGRAPLIRQLIEETQKTPPRILIVDDSITTRSLEKSILEANGYRVAVAVDGMEALERLAAEPFDLVITDVMMPRMDGLQLLQQMKKRSETEQIPVIIVTSLDRREHREQGLSLGADAYIVKRKFDPRELLSAIRQIL